MISLRASARPPLSLSLTLSAHSSSLWVVISARRSQFTWNPFWDYPLTVLPFSVILYAYRHWDFRVIFALLVIVSPLWTPFFNICIYVSVAGVCVCVFVATDSNCPNVSVWKSNEQWQRGKITKSTDLNGELSIPPNQHIEHSGKKRFRQILAQ